MKTACNRCVRLGAPILTFVMVGACAASKGPGPPLPVHMSIETADCYQVELANGDPICPHQDQPDGKTVYHFRIAGLTTPHPTDGVLDVLVSMGDNAPQEIPPLQVVLNTKPQAVKFDFEALDTLNSCGRFELNLSARARGETYAGIVDEPCN